MTAPVTSTGVGDRHGPRLSRLRKRLTRFFSLRTTNLAIGFLILVSVTLTLAELSLPEGSDVLLTIEIINYLITLIFAVELSLRFVAESTGDHYVRSYFRKWWLDLIAVVPFLIPTFTGLRLLRGLRTFRFLRLLRLGRAFSSATEFLPYIVRRGSVHFALVTFALFATVAVGTSVVLSFERISNPEIDSFGEAFWFSLYSLFAGEPVPNPPETISGRVVSIFVMFMGLLVFAAFIGTVSAFMLERLQKESRGIGKGQIMEDHIILCGLGQVGYRVLQVLRRLDQDVVAIENDEDSIFLEKARRIGIPLLIEDVRQPGLLVEAGIARARAVIACTNDDLVNLEIALDARHERPDIRVVLRLFDDRLAPKIAEGFDIQVALSSSALAAPAFAAAAIDRSVKGSLELGDRVYIHSAFEVPVESTLTGRTVSELRDRFEVHTLRYVDREGDHWAPAHDSAIPGGCIVDVIGPFDAVAHLKKVCGVEQDLVRAVRNPKFAEHRGDAPGSGPAGVPEPRQQRDEDGIALVEQEADGSDEAEAGRLG